MQAHVVKASALLLAVHMNGCVEGAAPAKSARTDHVFIAPGVELVLNGSAGPEARRIAEEIESKYAAELTSARPADAGGWQRW